MGVVLVGDTTPFECNGRADLCDRKLSEVAMVATHNSFANPTEGFENSFILPFFSNQERTIPQQLADGVRVINLDVHNFNGQMALCHGLCSIGVYPTGAYNLDM
jgi:hypothetical protein